MLRKLPHFFLLLALNFSISATEKEPVCVYAVKKGDTLSGILIRLGIRPAWGPTGSVHSTAEKNREKVFRNGDLIFPDVRIAIPRSIVAKNEECLDNTQEHDLNRRIALFAEAETQVRQGGYSDLCQKLVVASQRETTPDRQGRLLHLAAICEYQDGKLENAYRNWSRILEITDEPSLVFRVNYNLALVECQASQSAAGYERLRTISREVWQAQNPFERQTFMDLATYCAENAKGKSAKIDTLVGVIEDKQSPGLHAYAFTKLKEEFSDAQRCDVTRDVLEKLKGGTQDVSELQVAWEAACVAPNKRRELQLYLGPTLLQYTYGTATQSWMGVGAGAMIGAHSEEGWGSKVEIDALAQTIGKWGGAAVDVRSVQVGLLLGKNFEWNWDRLFSVHAVFGYSALLSDDRSIGYHGLVSYGVQLAVQSRSQAIAWYRATLALTLSNSDRSNLDFANATCTLNWDHSPQFLHPFFWGANARYATLHLSGSTTHLFQTGLRFGVGW